MNRLTAFVLIAAASVAVTSLTAQQPTAAPAKRGAQAPAYRREVPDSLLAQVQISEDSARAIALREVPHGRVEALELEVENGTLVYSWDIKVRGQSGITEVQVSALNGKVVAKEHEAH